MENKKIKIEVGQEYYDICVMHGFGGLEFSMNKFTIDKINKKTLKTSLCHYDKIEIETFLERIDSERYVLIKDFGEKHISNLLNFFTKTVESFNKQIQQYTNKHPRYKEMLDSIERAEMLKELFADFSFKKKTAVLSEINNRANVSAAKQFSTM